MNINQPSLFSEKDLARMISPTFSRKKNHAEWELRKSRLGAIRADLSKGLILSDEGYPIIKPFFGIPYSPLVDFKEAISSDDYNQCKVDLRTKALQVWHPNTHIEHLRNTDRK